MSDLVPSEATMYATTNDEAERALLAAVLTGDPLAADLLPKVNQRDFYQPKHASIWAACIAVDAAGQRVDPRTLDLPATARGYLIDLMTMDCHPILAQQYAEKVVEAAQRRRMVNASIAIRQLAENAHDVGEAMADARSAVEDAASTVVDDEAGIDAADLFTKTLDELENPIRDPGVLTGWPDLDDYMGGMRPGQVTVVGARPKFGKSVIASNIAMAAARAGVGVHFASLEMTDFEVMSRMISAQAKINLKSLMERDLNEGDWDRMRTQANEIHTWPLRVDHQAGQSLAQIRSRARLTSKRWPLGLIVVDYLQLMHADPRMSREQAVGANSEGMKVLAKDLNVAVVLLSQLSRAVTDRKDQRPMMSDLRESGRIEQDADRILLLHREDMVDPNSATGIIEINVAANRHGPSGRTVELDFQGHYSRAALRARPPSPSPVAWSPSAMAVDR